MNKNNISAHPPACPSPPHVWCSHLLLSSYSALSPCERSTWQESLTYCHCIGQCKRVHFQPLCWNHKVFGYKSNWLTAIAMVNASELFSSHRAETRKFSVWQASNIPALTKTSSYSICMCKVCVMRSFGPPIGYPNYKVSFFIKMSGYT